MPRNSSVNFYLKDKGTDGKCLILLQFHYDTYRLRYTFGEKISQAQWNKKKQRAKADIKTQDGKFNLNQLLQTLDDTLTGAYLREKANGIPLPATLKKYLDAVLNQHKPVSNAPKKETLYSLIDRFISGEIKAKGEERSQRTRNGYVYFKKHLQDFEAAKKYRVDFDTITLDFFYKYVDFLKKDIPLQQDKTQKGLKRNTIAKDINLLKAVLNVAVYLPGNLVTVMDYKNPEFVYSEEETDNIYLSEKEVINLYNFDFTDNKRLEQIRDLFVFGCFTGLRFSDYSNVQPENIKEMEGDLFISIHTQKTGEHVVIPCNPIVLKIFDRYQGNTNRLPRAVSNQKFNDYIKEVCRKAGLTDTGRLSTDLKKATYECVSSHTARRSFATNLYLEGYPTLEIMKITGHKTEKAFLKYIKVTKLDAAKRLNQHIKKNWSEKILRVA